MRRGITPLVVVLVLQLALALALFMRRDPLAGVTSDTPLVRAEMVKGADQLVIEGKSPDAAMSAPGAAPATPAGGSTRIVLQKKNGAWVLPDSFDAPADGGKVESLLSRLTSLKRGLPIATSEPALRRFKLVDSDFERRLVLGAGGKTLGTVYFGSSPGLRKSDARTSDDHAVYAVDLPTYELPTEVGAWLNAGLLRGEAEKLAEIDVAGAGASHEKIQLLRQKGTDKQPDTWTDPALGAEQRVDSAHADALAQEVAQVHIDAVLGTAPAPEWQQDHPALTLTLKDEKAQSVDWTLSKPSSGDFYVLKSSAHPWYFSVSSALGKQMIDASARDALIVAEKPKAPVSGKT
jgi:hypothetical protein